MIRIFPILAILALIMPSMTLAQGGNAEAGKNKSSACAACHGSNGISPSPAFPHLAGQVPGFVATQLKLFQKGADGGRENSIMAGPVADLTEQDMWDLDAFYSSQPPAVGSITPDQQELALSGKSVYRTGQAKYNIPSCMGCHGPAGKGIAPHYPRIAGQPIDYIRAQLIAYKSGDRVHAMMNDIAFPLSMDQIEALSAYISGLN